MERKIITVSLLSVATISATITNYIQWSERIVYEGGLAPPSIAYFGLAIICAISTCWFAWQFFTTSGKTIADKWWTQEYQNRIFNNGIIVAIFLLIAIFAVHALTTGTTTPSPYVDLKT